MKELLLLLCRYPIDLGNRETVSKLISEVQDWKELVRLINAHGIIALAAYNIKEAGLENEVPADAMTALENGYRQSVVRNIWLTERWKEVDEILGKAGIKHILLKGMALEHTIYGAGGLRQMNDNDILIKREEAKEAWYILQKFGFKYNAPKSPLHLKIMTDLSHHLPALYKDGYSLEIHTQLFDYKTTGEMDQTDPFEDYIQIKVDNKKALILLDEIHLKYLIWHFERHRLSGESQLRLYADISILSPDNLVAFDDQFIMNPDQKENPAFRQAAYKAKVLFINPGYRWLFVLGDLFPSIGWMKTRYRCGGMKAVLYYPHRLGKLWWLV
jgi:hypothetical protein